MDTDEYRSVS